MPVAVPRAACLLRGTILRKRPHTDGAGGSRSAQVLAQDVQPKRGYVSGRNRRGARRDRTLPVHPHPGAAVPPDRALRLQPALPGGRARPLLLEQRVHHVADGGEQPRHHAHHVPRPLPHLQGALEPDHRGSGVQRAQDVHGDELETVRRFDGQLQGRTAKREETGKGPGRVVETPGRARAEPQQEPAELDGGRGGRRRPALRQPRLHQPGSAEQQSPRRQEVIRWRGHRATRRPGVRKRPTRRLAQYNISEMELKIQQTVNPIHPRFVHSSLATETTKLAAK